MTSNDNDNTCISIQNLNFKYDSSPILENFSITFNHSSRYLIAGVNGCGKSTLMKLIGGKTIAPPDTIKVMNYDPFRDVHNPHHIAYLNNDWGTRTVAYSGYNMPLQSGLKVDDMMVKLKEQYPERNQELIDVLKINTNWRLNEVSEGQRKRIQLYLGLLRPFTVCLLDEITVNLDIIIKFRLMEYLKKESIQNHACIIYITHIFDGLDEWCSDLLYMNPHGHIGYFDKKPNELLYPYLLRRIQCDTSDSYTTQSHDDEKGIHEYRNTCTKNAGGFTHGVLVSYTHSS